MSDKKPYLSIVIPVYNSAAIFPELYRRILGSVGESVKSFEVIAVLDGCKDESYQVISNICKSDERIRLIEFSRNFGHQSAITAGLEAACGTRIAIMDDDLEDPPEVLTELLNRMGEDFDVVYGIRKRRKRSIFYRFLYRVFYRVFGRIADYDIPSDSGDFCVMSDKVVNVLKSMPERNRYLRGLRAWSGFRQTGYEYSRDDRFANRSGYSLAKYFSLAFDAIFSFSYKPLKIVSVAGFLISVASFLLGARIIFLKLFGFTTAIPGWTSLTVSILFLSGLQLISIGIIGEYIARIYDEVKQRPKYIVRRTVGFGDKPDDHTL